MMDTNELKDWLGNFSSQNVQIWCEDPETATTVGIMSKTYLTYRILMKQMGRDVVGIRHRYSEFESLRTSLKDRYATMGILIPSLPPKNSVTSIVTVRTGDRSFIKERTLGLTMFCESIVVSPWLKNDSQWISFMKPPAANGVVIANDNGNNLGETRLIAILSQLDIPYKYTMVQRMEDIKEEVLLIEKNVKTLLSQVRVAQNCEKSLTAANETILNQLSIWLDAERSGVKSLAGRAFDENESILTPPELQTSTLSATINLLKNKHDSLDNNAEYTGLTLATVLEQELAMVESFKELFKVHEEILYSIDALSTKLGKTETSKNANKDALCADLRKNLEEKQTCLSAFYKGFIYFTLPWSARQRALTIRKLSCAISASYLTSSFALQKHCLTYFESLNVNPSSAISETSRMLELLGIKMLEQLPEEFGSLPGKDISVFSGSVDTLFQRAVHIGKGKTGSPHVPAPGAPAQGPYGNAPSTPTRDTSGSGSDPSNVITASVAQSVPIVSEGQKANPLAARRGSAILNKTQSFMDATPEKSHVSSTSASVAAERNSNLDDLGLDNVEIAEKTPTKQQSNPFEDDSAARPVSTHLPAPLSSKTKSLLDDLMGGGGDVDEEDKIGSGNIRESNVWG